MPSGRDYARGDQVERGAPGDDHRPPGRGAQGDGRPEHGAEAARDGADAVPAGGRNVQGEGPVREALEHCAHLQHKGMPLFFFSFSSSHNSSEKLQTTSTVYLLILKILNTWARIVYKRYNELFTVERAVAQRAVLEPERRRDRQRGAGDVAHNVPHDEDLQRGARAAACREPIQNAHRQVQAAPAPNARYFNFEYALCTSIFDVYVSVMMVVHSTELYKCACTILYS